MTSTSVPIDPATDGGEAEDLLFAVATQLVRLPFGTRTRELHIRALDLKRAVAAWAIARPSDEERSGTYRMILDLRREAAEWQRFSGF